MTETEGVIKFDLFLGDGPPPEVNLLVELLRWRTILFRLRLTGQDPERYGGLAYGNVSSRVTANKFIVSGTQTGGKEWLSPEDFSLIEEFDLSLSRVSAKGKIAPSSEALTHAAIYRAAPDCQSVIHVHSPEIWSHFKRLQLPSTHENIPYGTPAMALAVGELVRDGHAGTIAMLGHQDGIVSYGPSPESAALNLLRHLAESLYP